MRKGFCFYISILIAGLSLCSAAYGAGLAIHPMEQFVSPGKSGVYIASNQHDKALAVEVIIESWTITESGEELRQISNDLVAYPSQFILKGNTFKKIKVGLRRPLGNLTSEKCYRVTIRELPISLEPEEPGTFRIYQASAYRTSYYIAPKGAKPKLDLVDANFDGNVLSVRFVNNGNLHCHLRNPEIILRTSDGQLLKIEEEDVITVIAGENMHAKITRRFDFDLSKVDVPKNIVGGTIAFHDQAALQGKTFQLRW